MHEGGGPRLRVSNNEDDPLLKIMDGYAINRRGSSVWSAWECSQRGSRISSEETKVIREPLMDGY